MLLKCIITFHISTQYILNQYFQHFKNDVLLELTELGNKNTDAQLNMNLR